MKKILIFCLTLSGISCTKLPDVPCDVPTRELELSRQLFVGKWSLFRTKATGDFAGPEPKPVLQSDVGITETVVFSKDGLVIFSTNGFPKSAFNYKIVPIKDYFTYEKYDTPILVFEKEDNKLAEYVHYYSVCTDTLIMARGNNACAFSVETWVRE
jgi:hypothetical protein